MTYKREEFGLKYIFGLPGNWLRIVTLCHMIKLLTGIPKNGRKAVYGRLTGWYRLLLLPKLRQGVDPRFQMEHMDKNSKWPNLFYGSICCKGEN